MEGIMPREIERRAVAEVRAKEKDDGGSTIEGYAAVFNVMSEDIGFREVIMSGAFDRALKEQHDVRALVNHDSNQILGRTKSGTLTLEVDEHGLRATISPPDTQPARDVVTSIKRGDLDAMSFAFSTLKDQWRTEEGEPVRELVDLELLDVSVVAYPAYAATQVSARALEKAAAAKAPVPEPGVPNEVNAARLRMAR
jgi:Escherichia/Staphylococcus phage prohead protease